jgi:hypothetical protein
MLTEKIIENILSGNMVDAVDQTNYALYEKVYERIHELKLSTAASLYNSNNNHYMDEIDEDGDNDGAEYKKFFQLALKKFGVNNPDDLDDDQKKKFFNYIDNNWKSDAEEISGEDDPEDDPEDDSEEDGEKVGVALKRKKKNSNDKDKDAEEDYS